MGVYPEVVLRDQHVPRLVRRVVGVRVAPFGEPRHVRVRLGAGTGEPPVGRAVLVQGSPPPWLAPPSLTLEPGRGIGAGCRWGPRYRRRGGVGPSEELQACHGTPAPIVTSPVQGRAGVPVPLELLWEPGPRPQSP